MATIKPTLTITANSSSSTRTPGPISFPLNLSVTDSLTVDTTTSNHYTCTTSSTLVIDGSALDTTSPAGTAGTSGSYIYMKNTDTSNDIMIGFDADGESPVVDLSPAGQEQRLFTLKPLEFAWFPFDYCGDITAESIGGSAVLEYWIFDR